MDTVWYAALFGRRNVLLDDNDSLQDLVQLFFRQMAEPAPLTPSELDRLNALKDYPRHQHTPDKISEWLDGFINHCTTGTPAERWGWKVPYTHVLIDRLMAWHPTLKYVHISRNGLDMAYSANQNQLGKWGPIFLNREVDIGPRDSLKYWCAVQRRVASAKTRHPDRIFLLSFDRLVEDPVTWISQLIDFLGVHLDAEDKDTLASWINPPRSVDRHKAHDISVLDPEDVAYAQRCNDCILT
nr:sulfotransferase [Sulfitobacter aestuariivivens]